MQWELHSANEMKCEVMYRALEAWSFYVFKWTANKKSFPCEAIKKFFRLWSQSFLSLTRCRVWWKSAESFFSGSCVKMCPWNIWISCEEFAELTRCFIKNAFLEIIKTVTRGGFLGGKRMRGLKKDLKWTSFYNSRLRKSIKISSQSMKENK